MSPEESGNGTSVDSSMIIEKLRNLRSTFSGVLEDISTRVDKLSETVYGGSSATQTPAKSGTYSWVDVCRPPDDRFPPRWGGESDEEEEEAGAGVTELSEPDVTLIQAAFTTGMSNAARGTLGPAIRPLARAFPTRKSTPRPRLRYLLGKSVGGKGYRQRTRQGSSSRLGCSSPSDAPVVQGRWGGLYCG